MDPNKEYTNPNSNIEEQMLNKEKPMDQQTEAIKLSVVSNTHKINNLSDALRTKSSYVTCPYCYHQSLTRTNKKCNKGNIIFCGF